MTTRDTTALNPRPAGGRARAFGLREAVTLPAPDIIEVDKLGTAFLFVEWFIAPSHAGARAPQPRRCAP